MPIQPSVEYVLRTEYEEKMRSIDQKFDEFTEVMLGQFDQVYERFDAVDRRFTDNDLRFNRLDHNISIIIHSLRVIERHLGIPGDQMAI